MKQKPKPDVASIHHTVKKHNKLLELNVLF